MDFAKNKQSIKIRFELPEDEARIHHVTTEAFKTMPYSAGMEAPIIDQLRKDGDLTLSLVAVDNGVVNGHIAFSPVTINCVHDGWFGLGPVSVWPTFQKMGWGSLLINKGLELLRARDAKGCVLIGDPKYYSRFGLKSYGQLRYGELNVELVQCIVFDGPIPRGELKFSPAFDLE